MHRLRTVFLAYLSVISALVYILVATAPAAAQVPEEPLQSNLPLSGSRIMTAKETVAFFADKYGADVGLAVCIVANESGFNPEARNPGSSAGGIWQFVNGTWESTVRRMGRDWTMEDKYDMRKNAEAGAWLLANDNYGHWVVWPKCVRR